MSKLRRTGLTVVFCGMMLTVTGNRCAADVKTSGVPRYDAAVARAVAFIKAQRRSTGQEQTLVAYALLKAGESPQSELVAAGIATALQRATKTGYNGYSHIYLCGVDAMLLADSGQDDVVVPLQSIGDYVQSAQRSDGSWSDTPQKPGDVSMCQYGVLALWAAQRAGCRISPASLDRAASWLMKTGNPDGGWGYRPGHQEGPGRGASTHNMTIAAAGSLSVIRLLLHGELHGEEGRQPKQEPTKKFGILEREDAGAIDPGRQHLAFPEYQPQNSSADLDRRIDRAFEWNQTRFKPVSDAAHRIYFYYALERAAALNQLGDNWFTIYGDGLLTLQGANGSFDTHSGPLVGSSFAILYFMRSTQQILGPGYGRGRMRGDRDLKVLFDPHAGKKKRDIGPLDDLLKALEGQDFASLDVSTDELVEKIQFGSRDELVGQADKLRTLIQHPDAATRQIAYWALGRTGDFELIPLMLDGLKDPSLDVNVEALQALRYIARRPKGFGLTLDPLGELPDDADEKTRLNEANKWRTKASKLWRQWYSGVRPYAQRDGLDEIGLPADE